MDNFSASDGNCTIFALLHCQDTCKLFQNEYFVRTEFVDCVSRLMSGGGGGGGAGGRGGGGGGVLTHKQEQHSNCEGGCQKKFSAEFMT